MDKLIQLDTDEKVLFVARKHPFVLFTKIGGYALLALIPIFVFGFATSTFRLELSLDTQRIFAFFFILWILALWIGGFLTWTNASLDMWIITNKRVVNFDQKSLFDRETSSLRIENIQDVSVEINGPMATMYKFGDLRLETAGEHPDFSLQNAKDPENIKKVIMDAVEVKTKEVKTVKIENS